MDSTTSTECSWSREETRTCGFCSRIGVELGKERESTKSRRLAPLKQVRKKIRTSENELLLVGAKEFKSIWKSKTGNEWTNLDNFQEKPGKYKLFQVWMLFFSMQIPNAFKVNNMPYNLADIELPIEKIDEKAPILEKMLHDISNPKSLKDYAKQVNVKIKFEFLGVKNCGVKCWFQIIFIEIFTHRQA